MPLAALFSVLPLAFVVSPTLKGDFCQIWKVSLFQCPGCTPRGLAAVSRCTIYQLKRDEMSSEAAATRSAHNLEVVSGL